MVAILIMAKSEEVQRIEMSRLDQKDLFIGFYRLGDFSFLMQRNSPIEQAAEVYPAPA